MYFLLLYCNDGIEILCNEPTNPRNGKATSNGIRVGSRASYSCNGGYFREGPDSADCKQDGEKKAKWNRDPPSCKGKCSTQF